MMNESLKTLFVSTFNCNILRYITLYKGENYYGNYKICFDKEESYEVTLYDQCANR